MTYSELYTGAVLFILLGAIITLVMMIFNDALPGMRRVKRNLLDYNLYLATKMAMERPLTRAEREEWIRLLHTKGGTHFA